MTDAQLEALVAVADSGSFTQAARRLGLTQSAVSHAVTGLEQSLSVALIDRSAQGARLTNAGERVIQHARQILPLK
ncbi:MAG: LysR family transcriptional regulator, partial [bacterium]